MKTLVNLLIRLLGVCLFVFGLGFWLPLLTGTTWVEGILVLSISVVAVYLGVSWPFPEPGSSGSKKLRFWRLRHWKRAPGRLSIDPWLAF